MWDKDPIGKDFLGMAYIPLAQMEFKKDVVELWVPLKGRINWKEASVKGKGTLKLGSLTGASGGGDKYLNAQGMRGDVRVTLKSMQAAAVTVKQPSSSNLARSATPDDRELLTKTAINNFRAQAEAQAQSITWAIPAEEIELGDMLAEGTNAVVFHGTYRGQTTAIKVLKQALDPVQMRDFTHEFDLLSKLRSPYVVLFYGERASPGAVVACFLLMCDSHAGASINETSNKLSMVFEFCANGSLQGVMKKESIVWDWDRFFRFSIQVRFSARDNESVSVSVCGCWSKRCTCKGCVGYCVVASVVAGYSTSRRQVAQLSSRFVLEYQGMSLTLSYSYFAHIRAHVFVCYAD